MTRFEVREPIDGYYAVYRNDNLQVTGYIFDDLAKASQVAQALQGSYAQGYIDSTEHVKTRLHKLIFTSLDY